MEVATSATVVLYSTVIQIVSKWVFDLDILNPSKTPKDPCFYDSDHCTVVGGAKLEVAAYLPRPVLEQGNRRLYYTTPASARSVSFEIDPGWLRTETCTRTIALQNRNTISTCSSEFRSARWPLCFEALAGALNNDLGLWRIALLPK